MRTKTNSFHLSTASCDYDVIVITETWLKSDVANSELATNYTIYRCDRSSATSDLQRGGGTLIAVKSSLFSAPVHLAGSESLEQVVVKISLAHKSVYVCGIYLRPNSDTGKFVAHSDCVHQIVQNAASNDSIVILGDYNLSRLSWSYDDDVEGYLPSNASSEQELILTENMISSGLQQICDVSNFNRRLLDLAFVSNSSEAELIEAPSTILSPDRHHTPFVVRLDIRPVLDQHHHTNVEQDFDFGRCDYDAVINELNSLDWHQTLAAPDINSTLANFYNTVFDSVSRHTPLRRTFVRRSYKLPWWNAELQHRRNTLRKVRRRFFRVRSAQNRTLLQNVEAEYAESVTSTFREYVFRMQDEVRTNPSSFWRFIKSRKNSNSIPSEMQLGNETSQDDAAAAEMFANFFKSVYSANTPPVSPEVVNSLPSYNINFPRPTFSIEEVSGALSSLDPSKGPGPDKLPPAFIKKCASALGPPVCLLFNMSLGQGVFPDVWKLSAVTPVHKTGSIHNVENYRPISILCCLAKVLELLIHDRMYSAAKPIISEYQHGFVKNRSTVTNLMCYTSTLHACLEKRCQVDSIYFDFSKAFDKVPHGLTLTKLERLGFPDWIISWLRSYLVGRSAFVKLKNVKSDIYTTPTGVPQGSHLGPLIFILFANDLCHRIRSHCLMYADDLKIYRIISSLIDCAALQQDLDAVADWCSSNGMELNIKKCKTISFCRTTPLTSFDYSINGNSVDRVSSIKDLGVTIDCKLNFSEHISTTTAKAFAVLGFIRRNAADFDDVYVLKTLYSSLVRSILEYAVPVWAPYQELHMARIERVQRSFVRFALRRLPWNDPHRLPPYDHRRQLIRLESLRQRREYHQRMFAFDIVSGHLDCAPLLQCVNFYVPARRLRQRQLFHATRHTTVFGHNHPLERCLALVNDLPWFDFNISRTQFKTCIRNIS